MNIAGSRVAQIGIRGLGVFLNKQKAPISTSKSSQLSLTSLPDPTSHRKWIAHATIALGITILSINQAKCANNVKETVKEFVLGQACEQILKSILQLSSTATSILAALLTPEMLGDAESDMFAKERALQGARLKQEAKSHQNIILILKKDPLSMTQSEVIKSLCPLNKGPGLLFLGRYISSSELEKAIKKAQEIEKKKK